MGPEQRDSVDELVDEVLVAHPFLHPQVEGAVDRIGKLHRYLEHLWERTAEGYELNAGGYKVLLCLRQTDDDVHTPGALAKRCLVSTGAMTNRIDRLEARGYVERVRDTKDRRSIKVHITDTGAEVLERALEQQGAAEVDALSVLEADELATLNDLLRRLMVRFESAGDLPEELLEH